MQRAVGPAVSLALVLTCTLGTVLLGTSLKSRCADGDWGDGRQNRDYPNDTETTEGGDDGSQVG